MKYEKQVKDIHEEVIDEYSKFLAKKNRADIVYLALMNDIELEINEDEQNV